ncbi:MAG: hypothetical protein MUF68_09175 [Cyclobacteriaceae bacterium]|nr:hypothetical protein [Cyclobacteriaceae bacterium]
MLTGNTVYYPLQEGFEWIYLLKDGSTYSNTVVGSNPQVQGEFFMMNSMMKKKQVVRKETVAYYTDSFESGNMNLFLKDTLALGDEWEVKFKANGYDNLLLMRVKEKGTSKEVNKVVYNNVLLIEADSKMLVNGNLMSLNFITQYYYALGVGLILTTSSMGDSHSLVEFKNK